MALHHQALPDDVVLRMVNDLRAKGHSFDMIRRAANISRSRWERLMAIRDEQIEAARKKAEAATTVVGEPIKLCNVGQSLRQRLGVGPTDEAIRDMARAYRAKQAEQVAARSARAVEGVQSSAHRPATMPEANR